MSSVAASSETPEIVRQVAAAQRRNRYWFRARFFFVWLVLVGLLVAALYATGNISVEWLRTNAPYILQGTWTTVIVCVSSIVLATLLALVGAVSRLSVNVVINSIASLYVSVFRGTPLLVQILFIYLALPQVGLTLPALEGGVLALGLNYGAYMTEIFRAGIQAVPHGQREAALALGMPERLVMRRVVMPQAIRVVVPAIGNEFIAMIKDSSLISVVAVTELLWRARRVGVRDFETLQALLVAALVYWTLTIVFSFFQERFERRLARGDR